jgi:SMC interacting uncharacterized protein involved in chromosome segregation
MADQTTTFGIQADTSAVDKLSTSLKNLDTSADKLAKSFSSLNTVNQASSKILETYVESFSGLDVKIKQSIGSVQKFVDTEKSAQEVIKETTKSLKDRANVTVATGGAGFVGPLLHQ